MTAFSPLPQSRHAAPHQYLASRAVTVASPQRGGEVKQSAADRYFAKMAECLELLADTYAPPVTRRDVAEYAQLIARQKARDEARRAPTPQLALGEG